MKDVKYIAYYRVSTKKQGASGLGLEAQKSAVQKFIQPSKLLGEFIEIESGKKNDRPKLEQALKECKSQGATLVIAKLDRLSRNAAFVLALQDAGIQFVAVDNPSANHLTVSLLAVIAQDEAQRISQRTKAALDAKKERQGEWRKGRFTEEARQNAVEAIKAKAANNPNTKKAKALAIALRSAGQTLQSIAEQLNAAGFKTARGKEYSKTQVMRLVK